MGSYCHFMGSYSDFRGSYCDFLGSYCDFMWYSGDFLGIWVISMGVEGIFCNICWDYIKVVVL